MKLLKIVFFLIIFMILSLNVNASEKHCTNEEKLRLRELANVTRIIYELRELTTEDGEPFKTFEIFISGFKEEFYIRNESHGIYITYDSSLVSQIGFTPGTTYQLPFYGSDKSNCEDYLILTKSIFLPPYNIYSKDPLCVLYEEFELCKKFSPIKIDSHEEFITRINEYIKNLKQDNNDYNNDYNNNDEIYFPDFFEFLSKYYLYFSIPIIIFGLFGIIVIKLQKRREIL